MSDCRRCQWTATTGQGPLRAQQAQHAHDADHPLCTVCAQILAASEPQTCEPCLGNAQALLSGIVTMYLELPRHLGHLRPVGYASGHGGGDGRPLPGGDALVLLSGGSEGLAEDPATTRDGDPRPVSFELGWWALEWQEERGESEQLGHRPADIVLAAAGYLERRCRWAANTHPAFSEFAADLRRIHSALEHATCRDLPVERGNASCFDCGGALVRRTDAGTGLAETDMVCQECERRYSPAAYTLALRAAWEQRIEGWVSVTDAAKISGRSVETLETWAKRSVSTGGVRSCCRVGDHRKLVWWPDVQARLGWAS